MTIYKNFIGGEIINHPAVKAISFTGSTAAGIKIYEQRAKVKCETGGENPASCEGNLY